MPTGPSSLAFFGGAPRSERILGLIFPGANETRGTLFRFARLGAVLTGKDLISKPLRRWRRGREAEGGGLLNRYTVKSRIGGSNPPVSAICAAMTA